MFFNLRNYPRNLVDTIQYPPIYYNTTMALLPLSSFKNLNLVSICLHCLCSSWTSSHSKYLMFINTQNIIHLTVKFPSLQDKKKSKIYCIVLNVFKSLTSLSLQRLNWMSEYKNLIWVSTFLSTAPPSAPITKAIGKQSHFHFLVLPVSLSACIDFSV